MFKVYVSYDGCSNWEVKKSGSSGTYEACIDFVSRHIPPVGYDNYFDIVDTVTGRSCSYLLKRVARRFRLQREDLSVRK